MADLEPEHGVGQLDTVKRTRTQPAHHLVAVADVARGMTPMMIWWLLPGVRRGME